MKIKNMILISIFAVLTALGAKISIPAPLVPVTLQTLFAALAGFMLGAKNGACAMAVYAVMGLIGIPVFAASAGFSILFSPSFGYMIGFIACAFICGFMAQMTRANADKPSRIKYFFIALAGMASVYIVAVIWLFAASSLWITDGEESFIKIVSASFLITVPGDAAKALIAAEIAVKCEKLGATV